MNCCLSGSAAIRGQKLDDDAPRMPQQAAARPEQAGIQRHGDADRAGRGAKMRDAGFIRGRGAAAVRVPSGKMKTCRPSASGLFDLPRQVGQRLAAPRAVDGDLFGGLEIPSEHRDLQQFALQHKREVVHLRGEGEGLQRRLMLRGDDARAFGKMLVAAELDFRAANLVEQPKRVARPDARRVPVPPPASSRASAAPKSQGPSC